jgi:HNH endonuclease
MTVKTMPTRFVIASYWHDHEPRFVPDLEWPGCFACGYDLFLLGRDIPSKLAARWSNARLERAHIVARENGGTGEASNCLLLCHQCHLDAPMSNRPEILIRWTLEHEPFINSIVSIAKEMSHGLEAWSFSRESFREFLRGHAFDVHPNSSPLSRLKTLALFLREFITAQSENTYHPSPKTAAPISNQVGSKSPGVRKSDRSVEPSADTVASFAPATPKTELT